MDLRSTFLSCIFDALFLTIFFSHMPICPYAPNMPIIYKFYSENAFGHRFQCLQLFIRFSMQFIDFPDIGQLQ